MSLYRSGLRFSPPLALGGHAFVQRTVATPPGEGLFAVPATAALWQCVRCCWIGPTWAITERFYPRPCMGNVAQLTAGAAA